MTNATYPAPALNKMPAMAAGNIRQTPYRRIPNRLTTPEIKLLTQIQRNTLQKSRVK
jgi:hypothetical protein